jgi:hypothetical protein
VPVGAGIVNVVNAPVGAVRSTRISFVDGNPTWLPTRSVTSSW